MSRLKGMKTWGLTALALLILGGWMLAVSGFFATETSRSGSGEPQPDSLEAIEVEYETVLNQDIQAATQVHLPADIQSWLEQNGKTEYQGLKQADGGTYILIARGESASSGYGIEPVRVQAQGHKLIVEAVYTDPKPGDMYLTVITYPVLLLKVEGKYEEAEFHVSEPSA
ncbi:hypothetical protein CathTA2_1008 [Caldalkalibacillus thermarum TA2.A1]|uniref:Protease complex subunit PrcB family protein n=1 Tax=Caldalkalibacillus thermarum (strain TA2.A1) TaxID=986075 RepID=F5L5E5_CALTT|nr:protease complex subunit PrcB family protein [Caldalkalibacillus thermarum]EGL83444.1 hypothetical protein CathTA2_1008 [Caldalkalibacillus thermarum TA2.A1]QZT34667.1 protease complex subunit PrcB family protein [Caldalkalibacillus thermarum TA2.A1]